MSVGKKQKCAECGEEYVVGTLGGTAGTSSKFLPIHNFLFGKGYLHICNFCIEKRIREIYEAEGNEFNYWNFLDQFCQLLNIAFNPSLWEKLHKTHKYKTFLVYAGMMKETQYETIDWSSQNKKYLELQKVKDLDEVVPELREAKVRQLQEKWGANYCEEELIYLENLLTGIIKTQDVNSAKSLNEAKLICKTSLLIEQRIRAGEDFDKLLGSYEKLTKVADFTPKSSRNAGDFDSVGELFGWLEKRGWMNKYYDGVTRDILDNTMKNFQSYNRNLYVNENSISEEIDRRLEALKQVADLQNKYYDEETVDYDQFEKEGLEGQEFKEEY